MIHYTAAMNIQGFVSYRGSKTIMTQLNDHDCFYLHGLCWAVLNGEGAKNSKSKLMSPAGFETPHNNSRYANQRHRPLCHDGLTVICGF